MTELTIELSSADETQALGEAIAEQLAAGDLVMLNGELGAGKTTLTQGIGRGLGVVGTVASPTFIVARVHPAGERGISLIHADAYRITSLDDLETLDLDTALTDSVVVVEWGEGLVEDLSDNRLEVQIERAVGGDATEDVDGAVDLTGLDQGSRTVTLRGVGDHMEALVAHLAQRWGSEQKG
ncbi:MAG: tRNA (adenosine(37)-N6)-threonylcarbamoyltransferase complex ATPase subunit type 1 TsaE [Actinomycetaceae bacterium]|nr:tRNA (adenosine(37)-N6)-threonylcarbamoyltransferase complex ATPase subunit type 1 TsaE [Actinomycetaceae bacterium]MDU0970640.1 tRNA (adenosine(37)-N6)-threonylcarbamoyltransferase complex ATPase subunit type 1 TsaE [Actinomycetaceae bacterium]